MLCKHRERTSMKAFLTVWLLTFGCAVLTASGPGQSTKPRGRDLGIPFTGTPGKLNAITDVEGVHVGHQTIIKEANKGKGAARTGVTSILPRGRNLDDPAFAGWFALNGNGEMTGTTWIEESGFLEGPLMLTNTLSVGTVHTATIKWAMKLSAKKYGEEFGGLPVVAETWDGDLNDIKAFHVGEEDAAAALDGAKGGPVTEGNVGGGTGMICYDFKGGIGTSSRLVDIPKYGRYTVGVLVRADASLTPQIYGTSDNLFEKLRIPGGLEAFAADALLVGVMLQQGHRQAA